MSGTPSGAGTGAAFVAEVEAAWRRAAVDAGVTHVDHRLRGLSIRLSFAGLALIPAVTPALEHLGAAADTPPDLTVRLWDVASTGVELPRRAWEWRDNPARGDVHSLSDDRVTVAYSQFARMLSALDRDRGVAFCAIADVREAGAYVAATPLLDILNWWLQGRGLHALHAGALGTEAGGVLLAGRGGAGKSTTTLASLSSRLRFAGDDYCLIGSGAALEVFGLYSSARVGADSFRLLPQLQSLLDGPVPDDQKATIFLHRHRPEKLIEHFPLRAVLLPRRTAEATSRVIQASRIDALRELAANTISQRAGSGRPTFEAVAALVKQLPCYRLDLGTDMDVLAVVLEEFVLSL